MSGEKVNVFDIAAYILGRCGSMTAMKLQKLVYYSQAWSLVWDEEPLFPERIEAWANGPVVYDLFKLHQGKFKVYGVRKGDPRKLSPTQRATVDGVTAYYGDKSSQWLSDLTHMEDPWKNARRGLPDNVRGSKELSHASMMEYYGSLKKKSSRT
jgi:uncharacterized phage-associated protein